MLLIWWQLNDWYFSKNISNIPNSTHVHSKQCNNLQLLETAISFEKNHQSIPCNFFFAVECGVCPSPAKLHPYSPHLYRPRGDHQRQELQHGWPVHRRDWAVRVREGVRAQRPPRVHHAGQCTRRSDPDTLLCWVSNTVQVKRNASTNWAI